MLRTDSLVCDTLFLKTITQAAGCTVKGLGIAFEVRCGSVTMTGEGFPVWLSHVTGQPFPKMKICVSSFAQHRNRLNNTLALIEN